MLWEKTENTRESYCSLTKNPQPFSNTSTLCSTLTYKDATNNPISHTPAKPSSSTCYSFLIYTTSFTSIESFGTFNAWFHGLYASYCRR